MDRGVTSVTPQSHGLSCSRAVPTPHETLSVESTARTYELLRLDVDGDVGDVLIIDAADDHAALARGHAFSEGRADEIWCGGRQIATVMPFACPAVNCFIGDGKYTVKTVQRGALNVSSRTDFNRSMPAAQ